MPRALHLLAVPLVLGLTACSGSVSIGKKTVDKAEVEKTVKAELDKRAGQVSAKVTCPDDLEAKVGRRMTCVLYAKDGTSVDVVVTVRRIKDGQAFYSAVAGTTVHPAEQ